MDTISETDIRPGSRAWYMLQMYGGMPKKPGPEQAAANREMLGTEAAYMAPGTGEVLSMRDAWDFSGQGANALAEGRYLDAAGNYLGMLSAGIGAVPGLGIAARASRRVARWMDSNLPKSVNTLLENIYPTDPKNTLGTFAGPTAKTADLAALERAKQMQAEGRNRDDIWQETGWFQGADDMWRFEIDDSAARWLQRPDMVYLEQQPEPRLGEYFEHPELYAAYPGMRDVKLGMVPDYAKHKMNAAYDPRTDQIRFSENVVNRWGQKGDDQTLSSTLHEGEHAVQAREDFAGGGSPETAPYIVRRQLYKDQSPYLKEAGQYEDAHREFLVALDAEYFTKLDQLSRASNIKPSRVLNHSEFYKYSDKIRGLFGHMPRNKGPARDEWLRNAASYLRDRHYDEMVRTLSYPEMEAARALFGRKDDAAALARKMSRRMEKVRPAAMQVARLRRKLGRVLEAEKRPSGGNEVYNALTGEVMARNVQDRRKMTAAERRATPPWQTQDLPDEDQYIIPQSAITGEGAGMFIGPSARTANQEELRRALAMEEKGASPDEIWEMTGWTRGVDNKWRFEISDREAKAKEFQWSPDEILRSARMAAIADRKSPEVMQQLRDFEQFEGMSAEDFKRARLDQHAKIARAAQSGDTAAYEAAVAEGVPFRVMENTLRNRPKGPVSNYLEHPELFAAYPALRHVETRVNNLPGLRESTKAYYYPGSNLDLEHFGLRPGIDEPFSVSDFLHEGQHWVQGRENFGYGANYQATKEHPATVALADTYYKAMRMAGEEAPEAQLRGKALELATRDMYRRVSGEVEARNTQARQYLSDTERLLAPPWTTEDIYRDKQTVNTLQELLDRNELQKRNR